MKSVDELLTEHRAIEAMLVVLDAMAARLAHGDSVPADMLDGTLGFFEEFGDGCHHTKEEVALFPVLARLGLGPDTSPIGALQTQHEAGRLYIREMRHARQRMARGETDAGEAFAASARDYVHLLREHIRIEDHYFVEFAGRMLSPAEDDQLAAEFAVIERRVAGPAAHDRYHRMIDEFRAAVAAW